jgi:hypothetical protein
MLVWANMHPGILVGQITILLFIIFEGIKFINPSLNPIEKNAYKKLSTAGLFGLAASFLNPNALNPYTYINIAALIKGPENQLKVADFISTINAFRTEGSLSMIPYWFVLLLVTVTLLFNLKKIDITKVALLAVTGYFSFTQRRYIAFFLIAAIPVAGKDLSRGKVLRMARLFIVLAAVFSGVFFSWNDRANIKNIQTGHWLSNFYFPVKAAQFIIDNDLRGNMYNSYNWGGYLIWKLSPERKVFIDGRQIYPPAFAEAIAIESTFAENIGGMPYWKAIISAYNIKYLIIPFYQSSGEICALAGALLNEKDWVPVYFYGNSIIFVKDSPDNSELIKKFGISKSTLGNVHTGIY